MIRILNRNVSRFIVLVLFQVLILNNVNFSGIVNPYIYILFIMLLPFETPAWLVTIMGFFLGFSIDLFVHTPGVHAVATVFVAFLRPTILNVVAPRDGYEVGSFPRIFYYGIGWFIKYATLMIFIHHLVLFFVEAFRFTGVGQILLRTVLSSVLSLIVIVISQYFVYRK